MLRNSGPIANTALEYWDLADEKMERRLGMPNAIDAFAKAAGNQLKQFGLAYGTGHKEEGMRHYGF